MQLTSDVSGQVALITGGSSGLGQATALRLAEAGMKVFVLGRNRQGLEETVRGVEAKGGKAGYIQGDLSEAGVASGAVEHVVEKAGKINALVNNAGVMFMDAGATAERARWEKMFHINLLSLIEGSQAAIAAMRKSSEHGHIVSVSSLASRLNGGGLYGATKAALEKYMEQLRLELEHDNIRITTIIPGGFTTNLGRDIGQAQQEAFQNSLAPRMANITPDADGRTPFFGIPDDVARAVVFAIAQPIYLNVYEMIVRPAQNIDPAEFRE